MKKRLISLLLCLVMVLGVFTACSSDETTEEGTTTSLTLTMLVVTEEKVNYTEDEYVKLSDSEKLAVDKRVEQYNAVEEEINQITKAKFKTALDIVYCTEEEYYETVEAKLAKTAELVDLKKAASQEYKRFARTEKRNGVTDPVILYEKFVEKYPDHAPYIDKPVVETEEDAETDENIYPEALPDQVDILFIGSYEKYLEYVDNTWLSAVDTQLKSGVAKKLTSYVYPAFLSAAKTEKGYFAVPNNTIVGEYTSLLINKKICDKYSDISQITDLYSALDLVRDVAKYEQGVDPVLWNSYKGYTNVHFWSVDYESDADGYETYEITPDKFSVLGATYNPDYTSKLPLTPNYYPFGIVLEDQSFRNQLLALKTLEVNGYYGAENSTNEFAIGIVKGSGQEIEAYGDGYYNIILEYPVATQEDLFKSMFAVSSFTESVDRCMEIITHLNTNVYFRNLLQYGIEGTNYELTDSECATRTPDNLYCMDVFKTGNMFIAYPDADAGMDQKTWENAKKQDLDVVANPTLGFVLQNEDLPDLKNIDVVNDASVACEEMLNSSKTVEELDKNITYFTALIRGGDATYANAIVKKAILNETEGIDYNFSVFALYYMWAKTMGYTS